MRPINIVGLVFCATVFLSACSSGPKQEQTSAPQKNSEAVKVPDKYNARFETTKGAFTIEVVREWAPRAADRFHELVRTGFYDGARFYRVRRKFIAQFGISADPKMNELWRQLRIADDKVAQSNKRGFVSFAQQGPNTRTTQVFINLANNGSQLDRSFAPFGRVTEGLDVVDNLHAGYGEVQNLGGGGPDTMKMELQGDEYIQRSFSRLDQITQARIVE